MPSYTTNGHSTGPIPPGFASARCALCTAADVQDRHAHWCSFDDVESLRRHVDGWMRHEDCGEDRKRQRIEGICNSLRCVMATWQGGVCPRTGAPLHWREARQMAFQRARAAQAVRLIAHPAPTPVLLPVGVAPAPVDDGWPDEAPYEGDPIDPRILDDDAIPF